MVSNEIKLSMDEKERAIDNLFIEHLWRRVKCESIYLNPPESWIDSYKQYQAYFQFYNHKWRQQGIENQILLAGI